MLNLKVQAGAWVEHHGRGRPVPVGTVVDLMHFNGDVTRAFVAGSGKTFDVDGSVIHPSRARWSGWDHSDGGPMGPKFRAYRIMQKAALRHREEAVGPIIELMMEAA
ncbi:hypothetical protein BV97_03955 [Novosphingobium resinovorum]|uniref:Uncharacterized protein n=1 Tax=Novosphingobium resinovorum TaxID=158500 RepID=A0A031JRU8_9SPHN|nr:hypothetical protein [Novosphingobium resinovorum]EZP79518.1 hypothetical protein BV97_03955 [Novosphingobium resinovorum]